MRHAILAHDPALVTRLLRSGLLAGFYTGSGVMVREWINDLSRANIEMPPELTIEYALALGVAGGFEDARAWLARADAALDSNAPNELRARLSMARALTIGSLGEVEEAIRAAHEARALVPIGTDELIDTGLQHLLLRTYIYTDDLAAAREVFEQSRPQPGEVLHLDRAILEGVFSHAQLEMGELEAARIAAERSAAAIAGLDAESHLGASDPLRTLGSARVRERPARRRAGSLRALRHDRLERAADLPPDGAARARTHLERTR